MRKTVLITGGAGFIGSALCRYIIAETDWHIINLDKLTYAANLSSLESIAKNNRYNFVEGDIADSACVSAILQQYQPQIIMNLAAESHVDRSIEGAAPFMHTNIMGCFILLQAAREYWQKLPKAAQDAFRFHHISTDEVYGSLGATGAFNEHTAYAPNSPYSASKAASDHLVRAWHHTYHLPTILTNCSNNYGPYHFPEKLIPLVILNALEGKSLPVYGKGDNIRDWLYVEDHARALWLCVTRGQVGESYCIGGNQERTNLAVVEEICHTLDELAPNSTIGPRTKLITFVTDRPGHDARYAIDSSKIQQQLGWRAQESFSTGLRKTVQWYLDNQSWWQPIRAQKYAGQRLGLSCDTQTKSA